MALAARLIGSAADLISPLIIAVALGIVGNTVEISSARAGMRWAASRLLRIGVVLIGLRVALDDPAAIGYRAWGGRAEEEEAAYADRSRFVARRNPSD